MDKKTKEQIWRKIDTQKDEILRLASDLIKIPSENPPGDMNEIADFIIEYLKSYGLTCDAHESEKGRINLIYRLGKKNGKNLVLNGHMDVVPAGEEAQWSFPPYSGIIKDGFLLGRGASDMKGGVAGIISTLRLLSDVEDLLTGMLTLTLVPDEETMGKFGTGWILEQGFVSPDACVIAEPTDLPLIDVGQKGAFWGKVKVLGIPIHGSLSPYKGDSAILKACKVMERMLKITQIQITPPSDIADVIEHSKPLVETLIGEKGIGIILSSPTLNIGLIRGGTKVNMVPGTCELEFDMRLPIGFSVNEAFGKMKELLAEFGEDVAVEIASGIDPNYTAPTTPLVSLVKKNVTEVLGAEPDIFVQWATSDARYFRGKGIHTVHYGPAIIEGIHGLDEKVRAEDIVTATKVYTGTALDYLT